jgi:hypothetical protein
MAIQLLLDFVGFSEELGEVFEVINHLLGYCFSKENTLALFLLLFVHLY